MTEVGDFDIVSDGVNDGGGALIFKIGGLDSIGCVVDLIRDGDVRGGLILILFLVLFKGEGKGRVVGDGVM